MIQPANADTETFRLQIEQAVADLNQIRPFPAMATRLMEACKREDVDVKDVIQLIECEPTIASKVLSLSNSPMYGTTRPISTIGHAIVILGFQTVSKVTVSIATGQVFESGSPETEQCRRQIFNQAIGCATTSRVLAREHDVCPEEAFLAGIMQDIGQLVFLDVLPEPYLQFLNNQQADGPQDETILFGIDHSTVGQSCGANWGLPAPINYAIGSHHLTLDEIEHPLARATILGKQFAQMWQLGFEDPGNVDCSALASIYPEDKLAELEVASRDAYAAVYEVCGL